MTRKAVASIDSFHDLLINELRDLYSAEIQILEALPKLARASSNKELKQALKDHFNETRIHVERLEKIFRILNERGHREKFCEGMAGLIEEGAEILSHEMIPSLKDAAIIGAAQKVEHYEISAYGTAEAHCKLLDLDEVANLLRESLDEEAAADKKLTKIAEGSFFTTGVNTMALEGSELTTSGRNSRRHHRRF
jgi:ferritin-like metal-binding protein YciE